jgi:hypothetical protein
MGNINKRECFICCDLSGKSQHEKLMDSFAPQNAIIMNYPIIPVADAFGCSCKDIFAHNTCISRLDKCPTCRKNTKPNVFYTPTSLEKKLLMVLIGYGILCLLFMIIMGVYCDKDIKNKGEFCKEIPVEIIIIVYMSFIGSMYFIKYIELRWLFSPFTMKSRTN